MQKFNWAYIGSGNIAMSTARSIKRGQHRITAVYGRTPARVEKFAKSQKATAYTDFEKAVTAEGVDAVYIATPHTSHMDYAIRAMELGKPVLCEKPIGTSTAEVDAMIECAKKNNVYFCEAMWTWFSDVALKVKEWVKKGEIGEVTDVTMYYSFPGVMMNKNSRVLTPETAGGALLDIGIYPITYCYNLFGKPDKIECKGELKNGIDIRETVILTYGSMKCHLHMSLTTLKESCVITGTKGKITLPVFHVARRAYLKNEHGKRVFRGRTDYLIEFNRVAEEIRKGKKESDYIPFEATRACMEIMDECRRQMKLIYPFEKI